MKPQLWQYRFMIVFNSKNNYMFRPVAAIFRLLQFFSKSFVVGRVPLGLASCRIHRISPVNIILPCSIKSAFPCQCFQKRRRASSGKLQNHAPQTSENNGKEKYLPQYSGFSAVLLQCCGSSRRSFTAQSRASYRANPREIRGRQYKWHRDRFSVY